MVIQKPEFTYLSSIFLTFSSKNWPFSPFKAFECEFEYFNYFFRALRESFQNFEFSQNYTPQVGSPKKKFEDIPIIQGEVNANFAKDPSSSLGVEPAQANEVATWSNMGSIILGKLIFFKKLSRYALKK